MQIWLNNSMGLELNGNVLVFTESKPAAIELLKKEAKTSLENLISKILNS